MMGFKPKRDPHRVEPVATQFAHALGNMSRNEFAPKPEYSLEQAASLLHRHITELDETEASLSEQIFAAETQLVELKRRLAVTQTTGTIMKEAATKLLDQSVAAKPPYVKPALREVPKPEAERALPSFLKEAKQ